MPTKPKPEEDPFLMGYLCAVQNMIALHDQPTIAEDVLRESGYTEAQYLRAQRASGFNSRKMCPIIREAFRQR